MNLSIDAWLERFPDSPSEQVTSFREGLFAGSLLLPMTIEGGYCLPLHGIFAPKKYEFLPKLCSIPDEISALPLIQRGTIFLGQSNYWHFLFDGLATLRGPFFETENIYFREDIPDDWVRFVIDHLSVEHSHCNFVAKRMYGGISRLSEVRCPWVGSIRDRVARLRECSSRFSVQRVNYKRGRYGVWVSRRSATKRRLLNESELVQVVRQKVPDLVVVDPSELGLAEQISLFAGASYVLGPHGAGLANTVFCDHPIGILEVWHSFNQPFCRLLADGVGCDYVSVRGMPSNVNLDGHRIDDSDFTVSTTDFRRAVDMLVT
jgi:hypothetical protein